MMYKKVLNDFGYMALINYHSELLKDSNSYPIYKNSDIELLRALYFINNFDYPDSVIIHIKDKGVDRINNHRFLRELARYVVLILKEHDLSLLLLARCVEIDSDQPAWVNYFLGRKINYYTQLTDNLCFTSIPKNSSTSIKSQVLGKILKIKSNKPHSNFDNPFFKVSSDMDSLHGIKFLVLRDPASRFFSYYGKNIVEERSLCKEFSHPSSEIEQDFWLTFEPTIDEFVNNIGSYCLIFNDVLHHILPQVAYCPNIEEYDYIVGIESVDDLLVKIIPSYVPEVGERQMTQKSKKIYSDNIFSLVQNLYLDDYCHINKFSQSLGVFYKPKLPSFLGL